MATILPRAKQVQIIAALAECNSKARTCYAWSYRDDDVMRSVAVLVLRHVEVAG